MHVSLPVHTKNNIWRTFGPEQGDVLWLLRQGIGMGCDPGRGAAALPDMRPLNQTMFSLTED